MQLPRTYTINIEEIQLNAYRLLCLFYASKEIAGFADWHGPAASELQQRFFWRETTRLLLTIAIGLRVLDDQMNSLPETDQARKSYGIAMDRASREMPYGFRAGLFSGRGTLRTACNRIIHALTVNPILKKPEDMNEDGSPPVPADHLLAFIILSGERGGKRWQEVLDVGEFVQSIHVLFEDSASWAPPSSP